LGAKAEWISFVAGTGAIVLTFLAGAELDPEVFRSKWKESSAVGLIGFFAPFVGATLVAHYVLGWAWRPSWLAGVALSTTSVAVVYAVMLELGFNQTTYGKAILAACFINDLGTVIALGLIFSRWREAPLYDVIVKKLLMMDIAGATVYRGILGYGAKGHQHKATFFHPTRDLPIMVSVIDTAEKISAAAAAIEEMLEDGLIVISDADIVRLVRSSKITETADETRISS
jgi:Kef-type K+ transport system membrane component KefB